jgi:flagellar protein FlaF
MPDQNPYSKAASAYVTQATATDQRSLEGTVLLQAAQKLEDLVARLESGEKIRLEEINGILTHNRKLWELFVNDMSNPDHILPQELKNNIASLAFFVFKRTQEINMETQPEKFKALININRSIAAGLMKKAPAAAPASQKHSDKTAGTDSLA